MDWDRVARKVKAGVAGAAAAVEKSSALRIHEENLADPKTNLAFVTTPVVRGKAIAGGFECGGDSNRALFTILFAVFALFIVFIVANLPIQPPKGGWTRTNYVVMGFVLVFFGGPLLLLLRFIVPRVLATWMNSGKLHIVRWPLQAGQETRMVFVGRTREGARVDRITASLTCTESVSWERSGNDNHFATAEVRKIDLEAAAPVMAPDGSVGAEWLVLLPPGAPASFEGAGASVKWTLSVQMSPAGAPDSTHDFELLVLPEVAA